VPKGESGKPPREGKKAQDKAQKEAACDELVVPPRELSKPLRARIMGIASQRIICPSEFAREYRESLDEVSYDFRVLRDKGWLELVTEAPGLRGPNKHMYRATKRAFIQGVEWRMFSTAIKVGFREISLKDFVIHAVRAIAAGTFDARDESSFGWKDGLFDEEGWAASVELLQRTFKQIMGNEEASAERLASGESKTAIRATFAIAGFESPPGEEPVDEKPKAKPKKKGKGAGSTKRRKK
jgi:hypothetical protein